jgi:ankyrin repeat protein
MLSNESPYFELQRAIENEDISKIREILVSGIDLNAALLGDDQTPLALASELGFINIIKLLIDAGANIDTRMSEDGYTALFWAIRGGGIEAVEFLVEHGAAVDICSYQGESLLDMTYGEDEEELTDIRKYLSSKVSEAEELTYNEI